MARNATPWGKTKGRVSGPYADLMKRGVKVMERWSQREKLVWGEVRV